MATGQKGVSSVLSAVVLVLLAVGMGAATYSFLIEGQEAVNEETERVGLETINVTCTPGRVTWWVNNTRATVVDASRADLFVYGDRGLDEARSVQDIPVDGFTRAFGSGKLSTSPGTSLELGVKYVLELDMGDARLSASCRVGDEWWNPEWTYRRALDRDVDTPTTADVTMDAAALVNSGKLRADCRDIRGVAHGHTVPYRVVTCDPQGSVHLRINISQADRGEAYVYYGNLQAGSAGQPLVNEGIVSVGLGPEERVNIP